MPSHAMLSPRPMLPALAPFLAQRPPSAIGDAFAQLAQQLDPDRPDPGRGSGRCSWRPDAGRPTSR